MKYHSIVFQYAHMSKFMSTQLAILSNALDVDFVVVKHEKTGVLKMVNGCERAPENQKGQL